MKKTYCGMAALLVAIALTVCCITDYYRSCEEVRDGVLRLHITANSDSEEDQAVKLKVRDALLENGAGIFDGSVTAGDAAQRLSPRLRDMEKTADRVLAENGFAYSSRAYLVTEYFDTREYDGITLPAGKYTALRVALGTGEGKNWWCVMFPPLCLPAVTAADDDCFAVFAGDGAKVVKAENGYKIKFRIVETAERWLEKLRARSER